jgi:uncharacterized protein
MLALTQPTVASVFAPRTTITADGAVEGYASLFGEIDQARDMVMAGAFAHTLSLRGIRRIPMLFQHDPAEPIGVWLELTEDSRGLFARGKLIPDVQRAREVLALVRAQAIDGLSIGFKTTSARVDPRTRVRKIAHLELWEISIVTFPLLAGARVRAVKAKGAPAEEHAGTDERLLRRYPRVSFTRARAEREWKAIWRGAATEAAEPPLPARASGAVRLARVHAGQVQRRERICGWNAEPARRTEGTTRTTQGQIRLTAGAP